MTQGIWSWLVPSGKKFTAVYITCDHYFGLGPTLENLPQEKGLATSEAVENAS